MADRPQGTTQEPGRPPTTDRPSDMREQNRPQGTTQEPGKPPTTDRPSDMREQNRDRGAQVQERAQEMGSQVKEGAQEAMQQVGASASQIAEMGRDTMNEFEEGLEDRIRSKPLQSVLIAAGVGMLLGLIWKR